MNRIEINTDRLPYAGRVFIDDTLHESNKLNYGVHLHNKKSIDCGGFPVEGFIDEEQKYMAVACRRPQWLAVLAHESSHLDQTVQKPKAWKKEAKSHAVYWLDMWVEGKREYTQSEVKSFAKQVQAVELDCEHRTVEKVCCYDLPVDLDQYIQVANGYLWFYTYVAMKRTWYQWNKEPFNDPSVYKLMPTYLLSMDVFVTMPDYIFQAYERAMN